jgi:hypothetical protein
MMSKALIWGAPFLFFVGAAMAFAQGGIAREQVVELPSSIVSADAPHFPAWVHYSGVVSAPEQAEVNVTFSIYSSRDSRFPLWQESQNVRPDATGHYSALLGITDPNGLPDAIFGASQAQWLGVRVAGEPESARALFVSVPYALKTLNAENLQGHAASDFLLRSELPLLMAAIAPVQEASQPVRVQTAGTFTAASTTVANPTNVLQSNGATDVLLVEQDGAGYALHAVGTANSAIFAETPAGNTAFTIYSANRAASGIGARADALATTGHGIGLWGVSYGDTGTGVLGETTQTTGTTYGVRGKTVSTFGMGVFGTNLSPTGATTGVRGEIKSPAGTAGVFEATGGGKILSGTSSGIEKFAVDNLGNVTSGGAVTAASFAGDGSKLTKVNTTLLGGLPASAFLQLAPGTFTVDSLGNTTSAGTATAASFVGDGSKLTKVNAAFLNGLPAATFFNATGGATFTNLSSNQLLVNSDPGAVSQFGFAGLVRDDLDSVHSYIGQAGSQVHFRLSRAAPDNNGAKDFLITPYKYGMGVEYPGVIEVWSTDFSVHANHKNGVFTAANFWVGDQLDLGGLYATANIGSLTDTGNVVIAADRFDHTSHGPMNFVTRNQADSFRFMNGPWQQEKLFAQLFKTPSASNLELDAGTMAATLRADTVQTAVQVGSRTGNRVDIITDDTSPRLSVFPSGNVSIGSTSDTSKLAVGSSGQFQVNSAGAVTIGSGTPILKHISTSTGVSFVSLAPASCQVITTSITGASDGDTVALGVPNSLASAGDLVLFAFVSAPDTVSVRTCNMGAASVNNPAGDVRIDVWKH